MIENIAPDIANNYLLHYLKIKHHHQMEITKECTFMLPLPKDKNSYHEPFIELPIEYIAELNLRTFLSYKTQCECGEIIIYNNFPENE